LLHRRCYLPVSAGAKVLARCCMQRANQGAGICRRQELGPGAGRLARQQLTKNHALFRAAMATQALVAPVLLSQKRATGWAPLHATTVAVDAAEVAPAELAIGWLSWLAGRAS